MLSSDGYSDIRRHEEVAVTDAPGSTPRHEGRFDTMFGGYVLRALKWLTRWLLNHMRTSRPDWWQKVAWLYIKADVGTREGFEAGYRALAVGAESLLEKLPIPHTVVDVLESMLGQFPNELRAYFDTYKESINFAADYVPFESEDAAKAFGEKFKSLVNVDAKAYVEQMWNQFQKLGPMHADQSNQFFTNLLDLGPEAVEAFLTLRAELKKVDIDVDPTQFYRVLPFLTDSVRMADFFNLSLAAQVAFYREALEVQDHGEMGRRLEQLRKANEWAQRVVGNMSTELDVANVTLEAELERKKAHKEDRYVSDRSLDAYPFRTHHLPKDDLRRRSRFHFRMWKEGTLVLVLVVGAIFFSFAGAQCNRSGTREDLLEQQLKAKDDQLRAERKRQAELNSNSTVPSDTVYMPSPNLNLDPIRPDTLR